MGRKPDKYSNFLDDSSLEVLETTSEISTKKYPHISKDEFFSEGWMRVIRFHRTDDTQNLQRQCLQCMRRYAAQRWVELGKEVSFDPEVIERETSQDEKDPLLNLMAEEYSPFLRELKPSDQKLIEMHIFENLTFVEMAEKLKIRRTAVFMQYKRAIEKLRNLAAKNFPKFS